MILNNLHNPEQLRALELSQLATLCNELRSFVLAQPQLKAGHANSSLGVTELTVALHYVFNTPKDVLIWDVGHQSYIHKILTKRKDAFASIRMYQGISGFTKSSESEYDSFGAGHSSTSISALCGFAEADRLNSLYRQRVAVIGDGALTGGMSFEALNYAGDKQLDILVVLNDNETSIDANVGALQSNTSYQAFFEALAFQYFEVVEGNDVGKLVKALETMAHFKGPKVLRIKTKKGDFRGNASISSDYLTFQKVFGEHSLKLASRHQNLVAISPAMVAGAGWAAFKLEFPNRIYDVGIAEQHAVTMACGMATAGSLPLVHLYSTFSQRAVDQIIHDAALPNLHLIFAFDRAGLVGADGPTHHGTFDVALFSGIPNCKIISPADAYSLRAALDMACAIKGIWIIRYPKRNCQERLSNDAWQNGKLRALNPGNRKAVISFGEIATEVRKAIEDTTFAHFDMPFLQDWDEQEIRQLADRFDELITVEENTAIGGLGDSLRHFLAERSILIKVRSLHLPDCFIEHGSNSELLKVVGLDSKSIRQFMESD